MFRKQLQKISHCQNNVQHSTNIYKIALINVKSMVKHYFTKCRISKIICNAFRKNNLVNEKTVLVTSAAAQKGPVKRKALSCVLDLW